MPENTILPIAEQPFVLGIEHKGESTQLAEWFADYARAVWTLPANFERKDADDRKAQDARVMPIAFENGCNPVVNNAELPELNLDCFRVHAYEAERDNIRELANSTIKAVPEILAEAVQSNQAFGDIPLMPLSENTEKRLQDAILADEDIQNSLPWGWETSSLSYVSELNPQLAHESLHGEEQRVWDYLEREGLNPFLTLGENGGVQIAVRLFR